MNLTKLLQGMEILESGGDLDVEIDSIVYDSRKARRGSLFVCIRGYVTDGHLYISQALAQNVSAILVQDTAANVNVPWARVADTRKGLAHVANVFFNHPSKRLDLIGITGTKGKTTSTYMTKAIFDAAGRQTGLIGTIANIIGDSMAFASRTTPESYDLQALLDEMCDKGMETCVMEVSSQGLMLDRVYGCRFKTGAFTNLYHDHIGPHEHASMEEYLQAKLLLIRRCETAVINRDIEQYDKVRQAAAAGYITYGLDEKCDVRAVNVRRTVAGGRVGSAISLHSPWYSGEIFVGMPGRFNVYNALAAVACAGLARIPFAAVERGLAEVTVPGRVQPIPGSQPFQVLVDYAHNAASLESLLLTLREYAQARLIVVFGNGGDRARSRRFEMGEVAGKMADLTIITSDNPRTEDPLAIIADIITGISPTGGKYLVEPDRASAIRLAIEQAGQGDLIIIAGKGHENYQIFKDRTIHFDDAEVAAAVLKEKEVAENG